MRSEAAMTSAIRARTEASSVTSATSMVMPFAGAVMGLRLVPKTR